MLSRSCALTPRAITVKYAYCNRICSRDLFHNFSDIPFTWKTIYKVPNGRRSASNVVITLGLEDLSFVKILLYLPLSNHSRSSAPKRRLVTLQNLFLAKLHAPKAR